MCGDHIFVIYYLKNPCFFTDSRLFFGYRIFILPNIILWNVKNCIFLPFLSGNLYNLAIYTQEFIDSKYYNKRDIMSPSDDIQHKFESGNDDILLDMNKIFKNCFRGLRAYTLDKKVGLLKTL